MRRERFDRINIVPFVDIVLVLLVIVLATATFLRQGTVPIDLPESNAASRPVSAPLPLTIDANGSYFYDGAPVTFARLQRHLEDLDPNRTLLLRTDTRTPYGAFLRVMLLLKKQGITRVSIATQER